MDGPRECYIERRQAEKEKYHMTPLMTSGREGEISYDTPYIWNLKRNDTNELTYKTERDSQT